MNVASLIKVGTWSYFFNFSFLFYLKNHHFKYVNLKFWLKRSSHLDVRNNFVYWSTNETGPLPLCTFSVMGLSMCSSIFSESSPVRSKSGIINELSGLPNSVPTVRCSYTSFSWYGHTGHAYCICFVGKH